MDKDVRQSVITALELTTSQSFVRTCSYCKDLLFRLNIITRHPVSLDCHLLMSLPLYPLLLDGHVDGLISA